MPGGDSLDGRRLEADSAPASGGKVTGPLAASLADVGDDELLGAVVEVSERGYLPEHAERRAQLTDTLFTADVECGRLPDLERDPRVVSIELNRRLKRMS